MTAFLKNYSMIKESYEADWKMNGPIVGYGIYDNNDMQIEGLKKVLSRLKVQKYCGTREKVLSDGNCFPDIDYKDLDGNVFVNFKTGFYSTAILENGTLVAYWMGTGDWGNDWQLIYFDINGAKGPNVLGKDTFEIKTDNTNGSTPHRSESAKWIITKRNMDYLREDRSDWEQAY